MSLDIEIDSFTSCLLDNETSMLVTTEFSIAVHSEIERLKSQGWSFDWHDKSLRNCQIYKLTIMDDITIQGLVAIEDEPRNYAFHLRLAESAPHNKGSNKKYEGVGGHLFAIAALKSTEVGYGGFIYFEAKNMELVHHYRDKFGAELIGIPHEYSMIIAEIAAQELLVAYTLEGDSTGDNENLETN